MGGNRETNLMDDAGALAAYRLNYETKTRIGGADEFRSVQRAAAILTNRGQFDAALAAIDVADVENQTGYWRNAMLLSRGDTLRAADKKAEALVAYEAVIADKSVQAAHRKRAEAGVQALKPN
jgi:predicted negative regulator of RcsB-dependent stress response